MFDRHVFFVEIRRTLFGKLSQEKVDHINLLLDTREKFFPKMPLDELASVLAQVKWETAHTMLPIQERPPRGESAKAYFTRMYDIRGRRPRVAERLGNYFPGDGAKYPGNGYIQCTGRKNAQRAGAIIKRFFGDDIDFEAEPDKLRIPKYAAVLAFYGMITGVFTGKKLSDYIDGDNVTEMHEQILSRQVVNGTDRAREIAAIAMKFGAALTKAAKSPRRQPPASVVREAQRALRDGGYATPVTGVLDPATQAQITHMQIENGMETSGVLDNPTLERLVNGQFSASDLLVGRADMEESDLPDSKTIAGAREAMSANAAQMTAVLTAGCAWIAERFGMVGKGGPGALAWASAHWPQIVGFGAAAVVIFYAGRITKSSRDVIDARVEDARMGFNLGR